MLDAIDLKILQVLEKDARLDITEIARQVNLSRTPVSTRLRQLKEAGFIKGFITLLDRERVGRPVLVVLQVRLEKQDTEQLDEFERSALSMPEVQFLLHVSGEWNFILHISAVSPQEYFRFLMSHINQLKNVAHVESSFVLKECRTCGELLFTADETSGQKRPESDSV